MADKAEIPETEAKAEDWSPAKVTEDGVHLAGASDLPANHRLRAEALVSARRKSDPDGLIAPELIEQTAARMKTEREAKGGDN